MLQRNPLYTAITRAKKLVVLVGSKRAIAMATKNKPGTAPVHRLGCEIGRCWRLMILIRYYFAW